MCKIRQIDEEGKLRIGAHNGYTMVNFRIKTALNKCTFNISVMTIDRTWIHSTRTEGAVPTWIIFKDVQTEIPNSVIREYILLFSKQVVQGKGPNVICDHWPREKGKGRSRWRMEKEDAEST